MRQTKQKQYIMDAFTEFNGHATAEEIYSRLKPLYPRLSLATVYRNLNQFADQGLIGRVNIPNEPMHFDITTRQHHHAICESCGSLIDIDPEEYEAIDRDIHETKKLHVTHYNLIVYGICPDCQRRMEDEGNKGLESQTDHPHDHDPRQLA